MVLLSCRAGSDPLSSGRNFSPTSQTGEVFKSIQVYAEPRGSDHVEIFSWSSRKCESAFLIVVLLLTSCSGGSSSGAKEETVALGNYSDLYLYNAYLLDGHTVRWASTTIPVYGATGAGWKKAIKRWPTVNFQFVATKPAWGIHILGDDDLGNICGLSSFTYDSAGALEWCTVKVNNFHNDMNCARVTDTITHEVGHCIGVFRHTTDGGLMDGKADGSSEITSSVTAMLGLLYTLSPGTDIRHQLLARRSASMRAMSRYQADAGKRYIGSWH